MLAIINNRIIKPMRELGLLEVLLSVIIGLFGGVLPVPLASVAAIVLLCRLSAFREAQLAVSTSISMLCTPLQVYLLPVWGRWVALRAGRDVSKFTLSYVKHSMSQGITHFLGSSIEIVLFGAIGWTITAFFLVLLVRFLQVSFAPKRKLQ